MSENASLAELAKLAERDPAFASRLLKIVNSSTYALRHQIRNVNQAATLIGIRGVRNVGLGLALTDMVPDTGVAQVLLLNCLRRACAARAIAKAKPVAPPDDAFTLGLFLEVGLLGMARDDLNAAAELASRPALRRVLFEQLHGHVPHPEVGAQLGEDRKLSPEAIEAIRTHHARERPKPALSALAGVAESVAAAYECVDMAQARERAVKALAGIGIFDREASAIIDGIPEAVAEAARAFQRNVGPQRDLRSLAADAQRSLVGLNVEYERVVQHLEQLVSEKEALMRELTLANEQLASLAATDGLTDLPNKRAFDDTLKREMARSSRHRVALSLLVFDVDHFKKVNDTYGHATGDAVLVAIANCLRATLRAGDFAARYGGEEFVVLLPNCDATGAVVVAERLRSIIAASKLATANGPLAVTTSIGVACMAHGAETGRELFERADAALYRAKGSGRNRVCVSEQAELVPTVIEAVA
jgi:diguanylate cyclase (GGDEF)-like protein